MLLLISQSAVCFGAPPWSLSYPTNGSDQPAGSTLALSGDGEISTGFVAEVTVDDVLVKTHASETSPIGHITENVPLPQSGFWTTNYGSTPGDVFIMVDDFLESHRGFYFTRFGEEA